MGDAMRAERLDALRRRIARIGRDAASSSCTGERPPVRFGLDEIDAALPWSGLRAGALHELLGHGADTEYGTVPSLLAAGLLANHGGPDAPVLWAMRRTDLFPPGLAAAGLHPRRLILAECGSDVAAVMEEALRHPGLCAVVGELDGPLDLTASRRLQLAAEGSGVVAFAVRRSSRFDDPVLLAPSAAASRWRVSALPAADAGWLGRPRWRLELLRCRDSGLSSSWILDGCDARGRLGRPAAPAPAGASLAGLLEHGPAAADRRLRA
jgi:protein ImuA